MKITVQDFTGIYEYLPFMQDLRKRSAKTTDFHWLDCTQIVGTDCYCDDEAVKEINELIDSTKRDSSKNEGTIPEIHFFDNGNYHYMSKLWTDRIQEPFTLIVFDHHPDMQPPRFGGILSCGGWVKEVLDSNKFIQNVIIIGVKDELVETVREELSQSGEVNILDKVTFIKESEILKEPPASAEMTSNGSVLQKSAILKTVILEPTGDRIHLSSLRTAQDSTAQSYSQVNLPVRHSPLSSFVFRLSSSISPNIYISIDKDVLAPAYAATNWDQGSLSTELLKKIITELAANHKILGIDICGERAHDFEGNEYHTIQEADALNNALNYELVEFLRNL